MKDLASSVRKRDLKIAREGVNFKGKDEWAR
jgi:hypothetical protein